MATNFRKSDITVNGATRASGYANWISDNLRKKFQSPDSLTTELNSVSIQLSYPLGGYSSKNYLKIYGEQSSPEAAAYGILIPEEDYDIFIHKSQPTTKFVYSAVIIKKTNLGYSVSGYNTQFPFFTVIPSVNSSNYYSISVGEVGGFIFQDYENYNLEISYGTEFTSIQQVVDFLVSYQRYLQSVGMLFEDNSLALKEQQNFILSAKEFLTWHQQGWKEGNLIVLSPVGDTLKLNLLSGTTDKVLNIPTRSHILDQNFNKVDVKQVDINRYDNVTTIFCKQITTIGLIVLDVVEYEHTIVFNNQTMFKDIIYQPELGNRQARLKIIGTKTDNWIGTLDVPGFIVNINNVDEWEANKEYLTGDIVQYKTFYYTALEASLSATFVSSLWSQIDYNQINKTLLPNLATLSTQSRQFYDVDTTVLDSSMELHSRGLIGFRPRDYFNKLGLDLVTQTKFYQGLIRGKGSATSLSILKNVTFGKLSNSVDIYEDWAFRVGEYGATDINQYIEINLEENNFLSNPGTGTLTGSLYKKARNFSLDALVKARSIREENLILSAGYVDYADVNAAIFDIQDLASNNSVISLIYPGFIIWCALDYKRDWNVYRVSETGLTYKSITNILDKRLMIEFKDIHELAIGDIVAVKDFNSLVNGFYVVSSIPAVDTIVVNTIEEIVGFDSATGDGLFYKLNSLRYNNITESIVFTPRNNWQESEHIWIDNYDTEGAWAVLERHSPWKRDPKEIHYIAADVIRYGLGIVPNTGKYSLPLVTTATIKETVEPSIATSSSSVPTVEILKFGLSVAASATGDYVAVGSATKQVFVYQKSSSGEYTSLQIVENTYAGISNYGEVLDYNGSILAVGDQGFISNGAVAVYSQTSVGTFELIQFLAPATSSNAKFGFSIKLSTNYLVIGAPGANTVYIYKKITSTAKDPVAFSKLPTSISTATLPYAPASAESIIIILTTGAILSPRAYSVSGTVITFSAKPTVGFTVYQRGVYYQQIQSITDNVISGAGDQYGFSVDITSNEDKLYVGAPYADVYDSETQKFITNAGRVLAYTKQSTFFLLMHTLQATKLELNGEFGASVKAASNNLEVFVGSPGVSLQSSYRSGQVYRFTNKASTLNEISTKPFLEKLTGSNTLIINGFELSVSGGIEGIKAAIDDASISNIVTTVKDYVLTIKSTALVENIPLTVEMGTEGVFAQLGLEYVTQSQIILNPINRHLSRFGTKLNLSADNKQLFVSSPRATSILDTGFDYIESTDTYSTYFDNKGTRFVDQVVDGGSVCIFEFIKPIKLTLSNLGSYVFGQQLESLYTTKSDLFGSSLAVAGSTVLVGAPGDDVLSGEDNRGRVQIFNKADSDPLWRKVKYQQPVVDVDKINRVYLYDKTKNNILVTLDVVDPLKGRVLGVARQDIDFISSQDPASYNASSGIDLYGVGRIDTNNYWTSANIGRYWLDTSEIRFVDYEQQDLSYRKNNWNQIFPNSSAKIYQWVETDVLPSLYSRFYNGTPKYTGDQSYVVVPVIDKNTGSVGEKYYYWVRNLNVIPENKSLSTTIIESYIENPITSNIPYIAFYSPTEFGLFNVKDYVTGDNTVLHIDYDVLPNDNIIHSEYELVQEGNANSLAPAKVLKKIIDSLTGANSIGQVVPDVNLSVAERYGIGIRPRQTLFLDRFSALDDMVESANSMLAKIFAADKIAGSSFFYKDSVVDTTNFWEYTSWVADGYDVTIKPSYVLNNFTEYASRIFNTGTIIKIKDNGFGYYSIVKTTTGGYDLMVRERGTIKLLPVIYQTKTPKTEVRKILEGLFYELFTNDLTIYHNELFFVLVRYALREQKSLDWAFKTSFLTIDHVSSTFEQFPNYQPDNQSYLFDYINEAKPYHAKIREYRITQSGTTVAGVTSTDFDLPAYYDTGLELFRSPSGEKSTDAALLATGERYADWNNNHLLEIESISVSNPGTNFTSIPTITITGGSGSGATAKAVIGRLSSGEFGITEVVVTNSGTNYASRPTITVTGGGGSGAVLVANLKSPTVRQISTTLVFDRVNYVPVNPDSGFDVQAWDEDQFDDINLETVYPTGLERIRSYYNPPSGSPGLDYGQLVEGVDFPGYVVKGVSYTGEVGFDGTPYEPGFPNSEVGYSSVVDPDTVSDLSITSKYVDVTGINADEILFLGGEYLDANHSHAPGELLPGRMFDTLDIKVFHKFASSSSPNVSFRMFKNMLDQYYYYRMAASNTTTLSANLAIGDTEISVVAAGVLDLPTISVIGPSIPAVVFINGERITYFERDVVNNKLKKIRRGTSGTGAPALHAAGSAVVGGGRSQQIANAHDVRWYDPAVGLENDNESTIALFIKSQSPVSVT